MKDLTDPVVANSNGLATQTLKRVNLAFNLLNLVDATKNQQFMLEDTLPNGLPTTLKTPNQIYIILVQNLQDYDVYSKTSKWNYNFRIIDFFLSVENNPGVFGLFNTFYYNISI